MNIPYLILLLALFAFPLAALIQEPKEGDFVIQNFKFQSGETLPELKLHYTTLGDPKVNEKGEIVNAVLLLHGTTGVGKNFLKPTYKQAFFEEGQPLDASKYFIIMPDGIGRGGSSKPSDGLKSKFPRYGYNDIVEAQYELLTKGLSVHHVKLILGVSMGGMHGWLWGEKFPDMMDAIVPIACYPVAVTGRNFFWRNLIMEAIKNDPDYRDGEYEKQPMHYQSTLALFNIMVGTPKTLETIGRTEDEAKKTFDNWVTEYKKTIDANDYLYWFQAVADYDPEPSLENIKAKVFAINFEDDLINPVELQVFERTMPRVKQGKYVIIPKAKGAIGHQTLNEPKIWSHYVKELLDRI